MQIKLIVVIVAVVVVAVVVVDNDGNENVTKQQDLVRKTMLCTCVLHSLQNNNLNGQIQSFMENVNAQRRILLSLSQLDHCPHRFWTILLLDSSE